MTNTQFCALEGSSSASTVLSLKTAMLTTDLCDASKTWPPCWGTNITSSLSNALNALLTKNNITIGLQPSNQGFCIEALLTMLQKSISCSTTNFIAQGISVGVANVVAAEICGQNQNTSTTKTCDACQNALGACQNNLTNCQNNLTNCLGSSVGRGGSRNLINCQNTAPLIGIRNSLLLCAMSNSTTDQVLKIGPSDVSIVAAFIQDLNSLTMIQDKSQCQTALAQMWIQDSYSTGCAGPSHFVNLASISPILAESVQAELCDPPPNVIPSFFAQAGPLVEWCADIESNQVLNGTLLGEALMQDLAVLYPYSSNGTQYCMDKLLAIFETHGNCLRWNVLNGIFLLFFVLAMCVKRSCKCFVRDTK